MKKLLLTKIAVIISVLLFAQSDILPPQLVYPENGKDKQMPDSELDWYASAGIGEVTYLVEVDEDENFTNPVTFNTDISAQKLENLLFGHTYYWRVKAFDSLGESEWSDVFSFQVFRRILPNKPDDGDDEIEPDEVVTWKPSISGTQLSGLSVIQCQLDTSYFWTLDNQAVTSDDLFATYYLDENNAWAVGSGGTIMFNDGIEWIEQTNPLNKNLYSLDIVDGSNGWAVGQSGSIIYFNGTEWTEQTSPSSDDLNAVAMLDENNGWIVGEGGLILSFDGTDWSEYSDSPVSTNLTALSFVDANNGWAVGEDGVILYYNGTEWTEQTSPSSKDLYCLSFTDVNNGWAGGKSGTMLYFDGTEWIEVDIDSGIDIRFMEMADANMGIAGGKDGLLLEYNGLEWVETASGSVELLNGISLLDADNAWIVGDNGTTIMKTAGGFESPLSKKLSTHADSSDLQLSELHFGAKYFWRIRGIHETDTSDWSSVQHFYTIPTVVNLLPSNNATGQMLDLTVEWEEISGVFEYVVELCDDPNFSSPCLFFSDDNSFQPQGLLFDKTYYWHVKAAHTQDTSDFSETWSFMTLDQIDLVSPENGSYVDDVFPTLEWMELSGLSGVEVNYDEDENFGEPEIALLDGPVSTYKIAFSLDEGQTYYWKVRAFENGDTTNWSVTWNFTIGDTLNIYELNQHNVKLFPNPSNGVLNIEVDSKIQGDVLFTINNLLGKVILTEKYNFVQGVNQRKIELGDLQNGLYIVQFRSGDTVYTQKVILDR